MKKLILVLSFVFIIALAGCSNTNSDKATKEDQKDTVTIHNKYEAYNDDDREAKPKKIDDEITVPKNPKSVAVMDFGTLDTLKELGLEKNVSLVAKGDTKLPKFLDEFNNKKYGNAGDLFEMNFDNFAKEKPDIVLLSGRSANQKNLDELKKASPKTKVVYIGADQKNYVNSIKSNTKKLGKIFDKEKEVKKINDNLDKKVDKVKNKNKDSKDKSMYLLVNEGEMSTYGPGDRFGDLVFDTLGFKPVDSKIKDATHGQEVSNEYIEKQNPDLIFAMDRASAIGGKYTSKKALGNDVLKNVNAIKNDNVIELDPSLWYLASDSTSTTLIKQIEEIEDIK